MGHKVEDPQTQQKKSSLLIAKSQLRVPSMSKGMHAPVGDLRPNMTHGGLVHHPNGPNIYATRSVRSRTH